MENEMIENLATPMGTIVSQDLQRERRINRFLKEMVFPELSKFQGVNIVWLNSEKVLDKRGVDIMLDGSYVDIKAHPTADAANPQRFSFELQTRHRTGDGFDEVTESAEGWLVSRRKIIEKYLFFYYQTDSDRKISAASLVLVDRKKLINFLNEKGLNISDSPANLRKLANKIVVQPNGSVKYYFPEIWDVSLTHSLQLPEQPLNVIVKWSAIQRICDWYHTFEF